MRGLLPLALLAVACHGPLHVPEGIELRPLEDVLAGVPTAVEDAVTTWPATFLVGAARDLDALLAAREELHAQTPAGELVTVVDATGLDALARGALGERLLEAGLEDGGPILVDDEGTVARRLTGAAQPPVLVRLGEPGRRGARGAAPGEREVLARASTSEPDEALRTAALGGVQP